MKTAEEEYRESVECYTPNGREIRRVVGGKFAVQPRTDNYWITCETLEEAFAAYGPLYEGGPVWDGENHEDA